MAAIKSYCVINKIYRYGRKKAIAEKLFKEELAALLEKLEYGYFLDKAEKRLASVRAKERREALYKNSKLLFIRRFFL